jgi:acetyl esterase
MVRPDELDADFAAKGRELVALGLKSPSLLEAPIAEIRAMQDRIGAFMATGSQALAHERAVHIPVEGGAGVAAQLVCPDAVAQPPLLVYLHGGGFSHGNVATWLPFARHMASRSGAAVLLIDYPLSPEHPYPNALDAVVAAVRALERSAPQWGVDGRRLAIGGDSAGANLALAAAMALRDGGFARLQRLLLFYGVYSAHVDSPSWQLLGQGQWGLSVQTMRRIWSLYAGHEQPQGDWRVTPLEGEFAGLPAAWACVGTLDPLLDDSRVLQQRYAHAGLACDLRICPGLPHAFVRHVRHVPLVDEVLDAAAQSLRCAFE